MLELTGADQHQPFRPILRTQPTVQIIDGDGADCLLVAEHRTADRLPAERGLLQMIEHDVRRRIARLGQLLQHHFLLELEMRRFEMRTTDQVGEQVHAELEVGRQQAGVEGGQLAVGRGIEIAADILDSLAELARRAPARALEHHMLEQMRDAVELRRLVARSCRRVETDRERLHAPHRAARHAKAVGQGRQLHHGFDVSFFQRCRSANP